MINPVGWPLGCITRRPTRWTTASDISSSPGGSFLGTGCRMLRIVVGYLTVQLKDHKISRVTVDGNYHWATHKIMAIPTRRKAAIPRDIPWDAWRIIDYAISCSTRSRTSHRLWNGMSIGYATYNWLSHDSFPRHAPQQWRWYIKLSMRCSTSHRTSHWDSYAISHILR